MLNFLLQIVYLLFFHIQMEPNFPLNIDCYKINNWLEQRKKLPKDWPIFLKAAESKIKLLIENQQSLLAQFPQIHHHIQDHRQNFNYFNVLWVTVELEKTNLANDKNFLGQYKNKQLNQWITLRKFMKDPTKLVGVLNLAKFINQTLKFQIPGLKKTTENMINQIGALKRKIDTNNNAIVVQKQQYKKQCKKLGIEGINIEQQVPRLIQKLPVLFTDIHAEAKEGINQIIKSYNQFCEINGSQLTNFNLLKYFIENGDDVCDAFYQTNLDQLQKLRLQKYEQFTYKPKNLFALQYGFVVEDDEAAVSIQTLIYNKKTRQQLNMQINELLYFVMGRQQQQKIKQSHITQMTYAGVEISAQNLLKYRQKLNKLLDLLNSERLSELINLKTNPKTFQRIISRLQIYKKNEIKCNQQIEKCKEKIVQLQNVLKQNNQKIRFLRELMQKSKKIIEQELTKLMKRETRIVGDINKIQ